MDKRSEMLHVAPLRLRPHTSTYFWGAFAEMGQTTPWDLKASTVSTRVLGGECDVGPNTWASAPRSQGPFLWQLRL
jgi:hypothetical protein